MGLATVLTVSDGVAAGTRDDRSGDAVERILVEEGFTVGRSVVADEFEDITSSLREFAKTSQLIVTTGGTGFGPRDVTPEATLSVIEREAPGLAQLMIARGIESTPKAALSRLRTGALGSCLIVNLPGSPRGAEENLSSILGLLPHILELLQGNTEH